MPEFELMLRGGKRVIWDGKTATDAAWSYVNSHPDQAVIATRKPRLPEVLEVDIRKIRIIEPGDKDW